MQDLQWPLDGKRGLLIFRLLRKTENKKEEDSLAYQKLGTRTRFVQSRRQLTMLPNEGLFLPNKSFSSNTNSGSSVPEL